MFGNNTDGERGQVGIGTLIVFIAMVLVAAIAAGVLINTAGFLQTQAEATGEQSTEQVSNNLEIVSTTGNVNEDTDSDIDQARIVTQMSAGSDDIDLSEMTIQVIGPDGATDLTAPPEDALGEPADSGEDNWADDPTSPGENEGSTADNFGLRTLTDTSDNDVLQERSDRIEVTINLADIDAAPDNGLSEGQEADVTMTLQSGSQTVEVLQVPDSLNAETGGDDVRL